MNKLIILIFGLITLNSTPCIIKKEDIRICIRALHSFALGRPDHKELEVIINKEFDVEPFINEEISVNGEKIILVNKGVNIPWVKFKRLVLSNKFPDKRYIIFESESGGGINYSGEIVLKYQGDTLVYDDIHCMTTVR